jgi:serine/threonine-protein kinase
MLDTHTTLPTVTVTGPELAPVKPPVGRRRRWLLLSLAALVAAALGVGGWWYMTAGPGAYTTVPVGLLGSRLADAGATLTEAGLAVTTIEAFDPKEPAGEVLRVSPVEDTSILKDGTVTLTVSKGPDLRDVSLEPAGETVDDVEAALVAAGFEVAPAEHVYSDTVPAGTVIRAFDQNGNLVELGERLPVGTVITLKCSDGLAPVTIPTVVGLARDAAIAALTGLGLAVTESQAYSADVPAGVVKAQDPAGESAGYRLDTVAIVVSLGAEPPPEPVSVLIPSSIVGMTKFPALDLLSGKGFNAKYERSTCTVDWAQCVVYKTVPAAGTRQAKGSTVTIWLTNPVGVDTSPVTIPTSVVGMTKFPALDLLSATGFNASYDRNTCTVEWGDCVVEYTVPAAGTSAPRGSTVTIWLRDPV